MGDVLLAIDVIDDFRHADGEMLLASFRQHAPAMSAALERARNAGLPVVYATDNRGIWDGDVVRLVREAVEEGLGGDVISLLRPHESDRFVIKPRYSAFDLTPLELILTELEAGRLVVFGATTEMCVAQTAIDARERELKVSVLVDACAAVDEENASVALAYLERVTGAHINAVTDWDP